MERVRRLIGSFGHGALWWLFGICTTVLLISLWGRAVASDQEAVTAAAQELAQTEMVTQQFVSWLMSGTDLTPAEAAATVTEVVQSPDLRLALGRVVGEVVRAAYAPGGAADVGELLAPLAPLLESALAEHGIEADSEEVLAALESLPPLEFEASSNAPSMASRMTKPLTTATLVGVMALLTLSAFVLATSSNRLEALRMLAVRLVISSLSFAVILRVASWITDPAGGASPLRRTVSVLLRSSPEVPLLMAGAGLAVAGSSVLIARRGARGSEPQQ